VNAKDGGGQSVLQLAVKKGDPAIVDLLKTHGAKE
jgi:hypothetical protein